MSSYRYQFQSPKKVLSDRQEEVAAVKDGNLDELLLSRIEAEIPTSEKEDEPKPASEAPQVDVVSTQAVKDPGDETVLPPDADDVKPNPDSEATILVGVEEEI
jgi:hypothetical protein